MATYPYRGRPAYRPPGTEIEIEAGRTTFGFEGGMQPDARAGGDENPGVAGITKGWLVASDEGKKRYGKKYLDPNDIPRDKIAEAYKVFGDEVLQNIGKGAGLARIRDHTMALEVFDTFFQHGRSGGAVIIQDVINSTIDSLPEKERNKHGLEPLLFRDPTSTRAFGEQTLNRMNRLIESGCSEDLRGAIADLRAIRLPDGNLAQYDYFR